MSYGTRIKDAYRPVGVYVGKIEKVLPVFHEGHF
jgi:hypothetical protein